MPNSNNQVTFEEPGMNYGSGPRGPRQSWLTKLVIRLGMAKDAKQASIVLIVVGVLAIVIAIIFWPRGTNYEIVPQPGLQGISYLSR